MFRQKISAASLAAILFSSTLFFFAPLQIYLTNRLEFPIPFTHALYYLAAIFVFFALLTTIALLPLRLELFRRVVSLLCIFSLLLWLQGNILVWRFGIFDGKGIDWHRHNIEGLIDSSAWIVFIVIGFLQSSLIYKFFRKGALIIILTQLISLPLTMAQSPERPSYLQYEFTGDNMFNFSRKKNVIILVFDSYQSVFFDELINKDVRYKDIFDGFTYFRNTLGGFPLTYMSVPLILTGQYYDNSIPAQEFIKNVFSTNSIPKVLKESGFEVDLYSYYFYSIYFDEKIASNFRKAKERISFAKDMAPLYDVALFRYAPNFIKKQVYNNEKWFLTRIYNKGNQPDSFRRHQGVLLNDPIRFITSMNHRLSAITDKFVFKYYHLKGMHPPLQFNESLEYKDLPPDARGYRRCAKGLLELASKFLRNLHDSGVYDNSLIVIMGDHGIMDNINDLEGQRGATRYGRALPLMLIKPFASRGKMNINNAPVSVSDIPATIMNELGLKNVFPGIPIFEIKESESRQRRYLDYSWKSNNSDGEKDFLPTLKEFVVSGFAWLLESWQATGRKFNPPKRSVYPPELFWNKIVRLLKEQ